MSFMLGFIAASILAWLLVGYYLDKFDAQVNNKKTRLQQFREWLQSLTNKSDNNDGE